MLGAVCMYVETIYAPYWCRCCGNATFVMHSFIYNKDVSVCVCSDKGWLIVKVFCVYVLQERCICVCVVTRDVL